MNKIQKMKIYSSLFALLGLSVFLFTINACGGDILDVEARAQEIFIVALDLDQVLREAGIDKSKLFPNNRLPRDYKGTFPFWYTRTYDIRNNPQVKKYKDKIQEIHLEELSYRVVENSLTVDLPTQGGVLDVFLAKIGEEEPDGFLKIGHFFPIPKKRIGNLDRLLFVENGKEKAKSFFKDLSFSFAVKGALAVDGAVESIVPSGKIELEIILKVLLKVNLALSDVK